MYAWFAASSTAHEERVDVYLRFPGSTSVGVKLRNEKGLEIKALTQSPTLLRLSNGVEGFLDCWAKWSPGGLAVDGASLPEDEQWIRVAKRRTMRKFSLDSGQPSEVGIEERPTAGCIVELTELQLGDVNSARTWWTLGFESFGDPARIVANLESVAALVFATTRCPVELTQPTSRSYPAWLDQEAPNT
jgi:hypothetical protein